MNKTAPLRLSPYGGTRQREALGASPYFQTFFDGSAEQAISALLDEPSTRLSNDELDRLATLIDGARKSGV